ncbi:hypothetical protein T484DRAFT_1861834 [Baffinella frigidus]|nr:hypothetical protein T484DRAFT_1861834 [Cryptophyta sp. CCMP2293]
MALDAIGGAGERAMMAAGAGAVVLDSAFGSPAKKIKSDGHGATNTIAAAFMAKMAADERAGAGAGAVDSAPRVVGSKGRDVEPCSTTSLVEVPDAFDRPIDYHNCFKLSAGVMAGVTSLSESRFDIRQVEVSTPFRDFMEAEITKMKTAVTLYYPKDQHQEVYISLLKTAKDVFNKSTILFEGTSARLTGATEAEEKLGMLESGVKFCVLEKRCVWSELLIEHSEALLGEIKKAAAVDQ